MPADSTPNVEEPPGGALADLFTLSWHTPPGWDPAPAGFRPGPAWEPDPYWPPIPEGWRFWRVEGPDEVTVHFVDRREYIEPVKTWVPAPGWPAPRPGFVPADGWEPDRRWPAAPPNWEFWKITDKARDEAALAQVATRSRRLMVLNSLEWTLRHNVPTLRAQLHEVESALPPPERGLLPLLRRKAPEPTARDHLGQVVALLSHRRDLLVDSLVADQPVDAHALLGLDRHSRVAWDSYSDKIRVAEDLIRRPQPHHFGPPAVHHTPGAVPWEAAEALAAAVLRQQGFPDASVTAGGADGGVDVRGRGVVAQVKYENRPVGRPVLQQLVGAAVGARTACFSRSGYTQHAHEYAKQAGIALFTLELPADVRAVNTIAAHMLRQAPPN